MELLNQLIKIREQFEDLEHRMADPAIISDVKRFADINKEYRDLEPLVEIGRTYQKLLGNIETAEGMLKDPEMKEMAEMELEELIPRREALEEKIKMMLIPKDPEDSKDVIFEIRSGAGGDEASIFAGDLFRMYTKYFEQAGLKYEIVHENQGAVGGFNKITLEVKGKDVYGLLKFESGAHRVQRVPQTESQGRVHTSAATVVVMPKMEPEDIDINKADLKVDTFRSSGAGGQHVNKTESGVRFTHMPTGVVAESTDGRSQIKNREIAMQRLINKIREAQIEAQDSEEREKRKSLVGSGDRSDKIRTYNYPQNRVTDHRINLTVYNLDKVIEGELDEILEALRIAETSEKMKASGIS
ncbi:MAG: peptide chain release factor 1 [Bacteroidetes bacterium]|nr:peptide chain release factor 1 [Bacteroidota bacterium]